MLQNFIRCNRDIKKVAEQKTLYYIQTNLQRCNLPTIPSLTNLGWPELVIDKNDDGNIFNNVPTAFKDFVRFVQNNKNFKTLPPAVQQEKSIEVAVSHLNRDQIIAYNAIVNALQKYIVNILIERSFIWLDLVAQVKLIYINVNVLQSVTKDCFKRN